MLHGFVHTLTRAVFGRLLLLIVGKAFNEAHAVLHEFVRTHTRAVFGRPAEGAAQDRRSGARGRLPPMNFVCHCYEIYFDIRSIL